VAVHGGGFCASARHAFSLLARNMLRVVVLDTVTDLLIFLGKIVVTFFTGFAVRVTALH